AAVARDDTVYDNPLAGTQPPVRALVRFAKVDGDGTAVGHELHSGAADPLYPPGQTGALLRVGCLRTEREASQASARGKQRPWHRHGAQARARRGRQQWDVGPMEPRAATTVRTTTKGLWRPGRPSRIRSRVEVCMSRRATLTCWLLVIATLGFSAPAPAITQ